jgi:hypothetical protein
MYDDRPGHFGKRIERPIGSGKWVERLPGQVPPCHSCPKIPEGEEPVPASAIELSERNGRAYLHYRRCKAVGRFPEDAIVERNAAIILGIEEEAAVERERLGQIETLGVLLSLGRRK